jgi:AcrR family transcriptional regulator
MVAPRPPTSTRKEQREHTRQRILAAAIDVFAQAGFEASSLSDIAARAGVKKALVQYHFSTKEQLWQASASRIWEQRNRELACFIADTSSARNNTDPQTQMKNAFVAIVKFTRDRPQWLWFMFHEGAVNGDRLQWLIDSFIGRDYAQGQAFIRDYQARGLIRPGSPLQLINLISGALTYNLLVAPQTFRATHADMTADAAISEQVDLLLAMLSP